VEERRRQHDRDRRAFPADASLDTFEWRISTAHVGTDGPFSSFPGIDRTLAVLTGEGIALASDEGSVMLERASAPHSFPGEQAITGRLIGGPIDDLNVMTRRGIWQHHMKWMSGPGPHHLTCGALLMLVARSDGWTVDARDAEQQIGTGDAVLFFGGESVTLTSGSDSAEIFAIELWPAAAR
jgi:environmental stress-induced protein Ves